MQGLQSRTWGVVGSDWPGFVCCFVAVFREQGKAFGGVLGWGCSLAAEQRLEELGWVRPKEGCQLLRPLGSLVREDDSCTEVVAVQVESCGRGQQTAQWSLRGS